MKKLIKKEQKRLKNFILMKKIGKNLFKMKGDLKPKEF